MENRYQHDASTSNLPSCFLSVEWLLEESRQLREEKTASLHHRNSSSLSACAPWHRGSKRTERELDHIYLYPKVGTTIDAE